MLQVLLYVVGFFAVLALIGALEYFLGTLKTPIPGLILPAAAALFTLAWMFQYTPEGSLMTVIFSYVEILMAGGIPVFVLWELYQSGRRRREKNNSQAKK